MLRTNLIFGTILLIIWTNIAFAGPSLPSGKALSACIANNLFNDGCRNCEKATVINSERTNSKKIPYGSGLEVMFTSKIKIPSSGIWQGDHGLYFQHCPNDKCQTQMFLPKNKYPSGSVVMVAGNIQYEETEKGYICHKGYMEIKEVQIVKLGTPQSRVNNGVAFNGDVSPDQEKAALEIIDAISTSNLSKLSMYAFSSKYITSERNAKRVFEFWEKDGKPKKYSIVDVTSDSFVIDGGKIKGKTPQCIVKRRGAEYSVSIDLCVRP